jgi:hypothetical protein
MIHHPWRKKRENETFEDLVREDLAPVKVSHPCDRPGLLANYLPYQAHVRLLRMSLTRLPHCALDCIANNYSPPKVEMQLSSCLTSMMVHFHDIVDCFNQRVYVATLRLRLPESFDLYGAKALPSQHVFHIESSRSLYIHQTCISGSWDLRSI